MTATPIPRTLALTAYGDLDYSVMDELPPGRKPIETFHRHETARPSVMDFIRKEIHAGRQAYIIYPLIEESSKVDYENREKGYEEVKAFFPEPKYWISKVHGRQAVSYTHLGKLLPDFRQSWANYYVKYIKALQAEGIHVWGLTIQNEPMATQRWESCIFTAEEERDFLKTYLGPTLKKAGLGDKKIIVWDHNRDLMSQRASVIFEDKEAFKYAWRMGFHWYENWSGGEPCLLYTSRCV